MRPALPALFLLPALLYPANPTIRGFPAKDIPREQEWESKAREIPQPDRIRDYIQRISDKPHHAGSPGSKAIADYLLNLLRGWGLDASIEEFEALLPYPTKRKLELIAPAHFAATLEEPVVSQDKSSLDEGQLPTYNAYSMGGDITAPLVYVNYGVPDDYEYLKRQGIDVKGKIVVARYGSSWRGVKPHVAWEHGAVACLIYSDPKEDGYYVGDVYPNGPFRPKDGVQRGSVMEIAISPGDPLSPGWASEKGSRRLPMSEVKTLQRIPVMPISYSDAYQLLNSLAGPVAPENWRGALPLTYHVGPGPAVAHLQLDFDWSTRPVYNVIARIPGSDFPDQWVMYGNHHDAWVNGAADPASGAASMLETARSLAELSRQGWRPKRTVLLALWDAEEFGLIGSTEWAEKHAAEIDKKLVAYLNSDMNGKGKLGVQGSHTLEPFLAEVLRDVKDPASTKSLFEAGLDPGDKQTRTEGFHIGPMGSGSDYTAFLHHLGVASLNLGFNSDETRGIYHSIYDSFTWYSHFSDTDYSRGRALSQVMTTALMRLSCAPLLPFDFRIFAQTVEGYATEIVKLNGGSALHLERVRKELKLLKNASESYDRRYRRSIDRAPRDSLAVVNELLFRTERAMLLPAGLPGRDWFKNQIYAPGLYTGYDAKTLPGIREAAEAGRWEEANREADAVAGVLRAVRLQIALAAKTL